MVRCVVDHDISSDRGGSGFVIYIACWPSAADERSSCSWYETVAVETLVPVACSRAAIAVAAAWTAVCPTLIAAALGCDGEPDAGGATASTCAARALHLPAADCIASLTRSGFMQCESKCSKGSAVTPRRRTGAPNDRDALDLVGCHPCRK